MWLKKERKKHDIDIHTTTFCLEKKELFTKKSLQKKNRLIKMKASHDLGRLKTIKNSSCYNVTNVTMVIGNEQFLFPILFVENRADLSFFLSELKNYSDFF